MKWNCNENDDVWYKLNISDTNGDQIIDLIGDGVLLGSIIDLTGDDEILTIITIVCTYILFYYFIK